MIPPFEHRCRYFKNKWVKNEHSAKSLDTINRNQEGGAKWLYPPVIHPSAAAIKIAIVLSQLGGCVKESSYEL
jgi:hypothetical protein